MLDDGSSQLEDLIGKCQVRKGVDYEAARPLLLFKA